MFIGLDFGTLSVRGVVATTTEPKPRICASRVRSYQDQVIELSDGGCIFADADEWVRAGQEVIESLCQDLRKENVSLVDLRIKSVGATFTSCTVVPINADGVPLSTVFKQSDPRKRPHVYSKMWKHHSPSVQKCADDLTRAIKRRPEETWLNEVYGGQLGLEWLYPKSLEVYDKDREAFNTAFAFVEGGDYVVWALLGRKLPLCEHLIRSSQQAAYKGCFVNGKCLIKPEILKEIRPEMTNDDLYKFQIDRFKIAPPGSLAGYAKFGGLNLPLSVASIDAHACALGQGAFRKGRLVLVMGTSACFMISTEPPRRPLQGAAGFVPNGIVQGLYAYEFGQSAAGDVFAWLARMANSTPSKMETDSVHLFRELAEESQELECWAVDHLNGCRTPLMRGDARGSIHNISLSTTPIHVYLAFMEAISFGIKVVVRMLENAGIEVNEIVLSGGGLAKNKVFRSILSTVLNRQILVYRDNEEATSRGAAAYASLIGANSLDHLTTFEPAESLSVNPSQKMLSVLGNEMRFQRYATAALVRSFI